MNKLIVTLILSLAFVGTVDARPSSSFSHSSSSPSKGISLAKPAAPSSSPSKGISLAKPAAPAKSAPSTSTTSNSSTVVHEYHYFGGNGYSRGYYGGYGGGFGNSPFFWLWLLDRPQPVIVNGQPVQNGASGNYAATPSGGEMFLNFVLGTLMLVGIIVLLVWLVRKVFRK